MFELLLIAATVKEPPPVTLTEKQRMVIIDTITQLRQELDEAEARALFWYQEAKKGKKECI